MPTYSHMLPKVSVIIPTYNRVDFLRSAIASVLNQTFQDFEIIVVDDASIDNTPEVVGNFKDSRIKYIRHEVNKNGSAARNTGIKMSSGTYIGLLDDDDKWLPEKLEMQVSLLENSSPKIGGVYTGYLKIDKTTGKILGQNIPSKRGNLLNELSISNRIGTASTLLLKRECIEVVGLFDESLPSSQDHDMWIRISMMFHFECIEKPLVEYGIHQDKITTNPESKIKGIEIMLERYGDLFKPNKKSRSRRYLALGVFYCYSGDAKKGREAFLEAIKLNPFEMKHYFNLFLSLLGPGAFKKVKQMKSLIFRALLNNRRYNRRT